MNWRGINQIGTYLTQSGVPAGQAQDIVSRLRGAIENAISDAKGGTNTSETREITREQANNDDFYNSFKPPEERPKDGNDGRDGFIGGGFLPGQDGKDGETPDLSWIEDYIRGLIPKIDGLPIILPVEPECNQFSRAFRNCGCDNLRIMYKACGLEPKKQTLECPGLGGSICEILKAQARMLKKIRERLDKIEKQLEDAVECNG